MSLALNGVVAHIPLRVDNSPLSCLSRLQYHLLRRFISALPYTLMQLARPLRFSVVLLTWLGIFSPAQTSCSLCPAP